MSNISESTNPDKRQRFSVYVPNPAASLQLGAADYSNAFGYNGGALSVDPFLFIDVNKHTLYQSGTHSCWQVGGKWLQYSNGPMYMTSLEHTTLGAGLKMLVVAGAAQGQITAVVHRKDGIPRIVEYNNLTTRYRVEEQTNNVVRFLHGRKTMKNLTKVDGADVDGPSPMKKGIVAVSKATSTALGLREDRLDSLDDEKGTAHFRLFYPYAKRSDIGLLNTLYSMLNKMMRFRDVLQKYLWWITDNALIASITKVMEAANHLFNVYHNLSSLITNTFADFASKNNPETGGREGGWDDNRFVREATGADGQGWGARIKHAQALGTKFYAKVTSGGGPFDFTQERSYSDLTVEYDSGTTVFSASNLPTAASVVGGAPSTLAAKKWEAAAAVTMPLGGTTLTITVSASTVTVAFLSGETVTVAQMAAKISAADSNAKLTVVDKGGALYLFAADGTTSVSTSWSVSPSPDFTAANVIPGLGGRSFLLTVDHALSVVSFTSTDILLDDVAARINECTGHSDPAVVTESTSHLHLLSLRSGRKRSNLAIVEQSAGVLAKIGLSATQVTGADGNSNVADWEAVTATEVKSYIAVSGTDHIELGSGDFQLKSQKHGVGSEVKAIPQNSTSSVLGLSGKKDKIDGDDFDMTTPGDLIQGMRATVFELNKLPEDTRNLFRPLVEAIEDATAVVASTAGVVESLAGIPDLWTPPDRDPSVVAIVGRDGISMGTNDTLVGVASKGVCFYATGMAGVVDKREFIALIEKPLSNVPDLPLFAPIINLTEMDPDDDYEANVGFQVRSASDVSMRAAERAELIAVGRRMNRATGVEQGTGVARLGASHSAEVCAENTAAVTARSKGGRVELLGDRIMIGCADRNLAAVDIKHTWDQAGRKTQAITTDIEVEARDQMSVGVGEYVFYVLAKKYADRLSARKVALEQSKGEWGARLLDARKKIASNETKMTLLRAKRTRLRLYNTEEDLFRQRIREVNQRISGLKQRNLELAELVREAEDARADLAEEIAELDHLIGAKENGGVVIAYRDPTKRLAMQDKPSFSLTEGGITLRTSTQPSNAAEKGSKIDMEDDQVILTQGDQKYGMAVSKDGIVFKVDQRKKVLSITGQSVSLHATTKVDFATANKILLG